MRPPVPSQEGGPAIRQPIDSTSLHHYIALRRTPRLVVALIARGGSELHWRTAGLYNSYPGSQYTDSCTPASVSARSCKCWSNARPGLYCRFYLL